VKFEVPWSHGNVDSQKVTSIFVSQTIYESVMSSRGSRVSKVTVSTYPNNKLELGGQY